MTQLLKKSKLQGQTKRDGEANYGLKDLSNMSANYTVLTFQSRFKLDLNWVQLEKFYQ